MPTRAGKMKCSSTIEVHCSAIPSYITNKRDHISFMSYSWEAIRVPVLLVVICIPT